MEMSAQSKDDTYENTGGIYTGLILPDNNEYSTLKPTSNPIPEAQKTAKSRLCCPPYKVATVCLGLLCSILVIVIIILLVYRTHPPPGDQDKAASSNTLPLWPSPSLPRSPDAVEVPKQCPVGYVQFRSRCYYFSSEMGDWFNSRNHCKTQGADLVVIDTMEEQMFVHSHYTHDLYWIGLRNSSEERTWLWVDGSQLDVGYWNDGEPNNVGLNEDCVHGHKKQEQVKPKVCPPELIGFNTSCYFISSSSKSWNDSQEYCAEKGGHLAIIHTPEKQTFLFNQLVPGPWNAYWFGLSDEKAEGDWFWVDGTKLVGGFWIDGEPNNNNNEDCGYMVKTCTESILTLKSWNDAPCNISLPWICEAPLGTGICTGKWECAQALTSEPEDQRCIF